PSAQKRCDHQSRASCPSHVALSCRARFGSTSSPSEIGYLEIVEVSLRVRLRPEADFAGLRDGRVLRLDLLLAVQIALDGVADMPHLESVPRPGRDLEILLPRELCPLSRDDVIKPIVV